VPVSLGSSVVLRNIFFDVNASVLKPESDVEVQKLVQFLKNNPTAKIEIGGHTDNTGSASANQLLSESRAKAVYEALVKAGIEASRLNFKGYGSGKPVADNTSEEGRSKNRRTEVLIISL
jgi:outer membrane protein OmpA-like peptidoglycan-associated protein